MDLKTMYSPSEPCSCETCVSYCKRPGWWTPEEAEKAIECGFAGRMMLEIAPEFNFAVLSPAFKGNELQYSSRVFADNGCTFLMNKRCELFNTGFQPLECRFCHHKRQGQGKMCHHDIEILWNTEKAKRIIVRWGNNTGFWLKQGLDVQERKRS